MTDHFKNLFVLGRPASGKSEFIDFMKKNSEAERIRKFHIAKFEEIDDFLWIWEKFMDDDIWEKAGYDRLYSNKYPPNNLGLKPEAGKLLHFCLQKFNKEIIDRYLSKPGYYNDHTLLIEFACGGERSFKQSLHAFKPEILNTSAIFFVYTTREESWRRNVSRYQEKLKHSVLAHMVPKETFDHFYSEHDWLELTKGEKSGILDINGSKVPFVTMNNEPETTDPIELEKRYSAALNSLFDVYNK